MAKKIESSLKAELFFSGELIHNQLNTLNPAEFDFYCDTCYVINDILIIDFIPETASHIMLTKSTSMRYNR